MTTITKQTTLGITEEKRKENLAKNGYILRNNKNIEKLTLVKRNNRKNKK